MKNKNVKDKQCTPTSNFIHGCTEVILADKEKRERKIEKEKERNRKEKRRKRKDKEKRQEERKEKAKGKEKTKCERSRERKSLKKIGSNRVNPNPTRPPFHFSTTPPAKEGTDRKFLNRWLSPRHPRNRKIVGTPQIKPRKSWHLHHDPS